MTQTDPAWIAARLTPAQREALMWLPSDGSGRGFPEGHKDALLELQDLEGIEEDVTFHLAWLPLWRDWRATKLGLRVRAVVAGGANDDAV